MDVRPERPERGRRTGSRLHVLERLRRAPVWLRNRVAPPAIVLCYHRVAKLERDPFKLAIEPSLFEAHLHEITTHGRPAHFNELVRAVRERRRLSRAVIVTFDDGYADNLHTAKPVLDRLGVPATVFVASGYSDGAREFWWDALERLVLGPHAIPTTITLPIDGCERGWDVGPAAAAAEDGADSLDRDAARYRLMRMIHSALAAQPPVAIDAALDVLRAAVRQPATPRPTHRACTAGELRDLAAGGTIEIGSHTRRHPRLTALPPDEQASEIAGGKADLEEILGAAVASFAYPFGQRGDLTSETSRIVREAGFNAACVTEPGVVTARGIDPFRIPRLVVHHRMPAAELGRTLRYLALG